MLKMDREVYGPEFDDRLIKLVKENSAIYDARHPHYRRTPVRMAIWDSIAKQLRAPSRFLQTKWKNIRYNYLQEQKCLETGTVNTNIRKRRFTEDLSFLKNTAYRRDGINLIKQNNSEYFLNAENSILANNTYEVIELDQSEDEIEEFISDVPAFSAPVQNRLSDQYDKPENSDDTCHTNTSNIKEIYHTNTNNIKDHPSQQNVQATSANINGFNSPTNSHNSSRSSPLLTPLSVITKDGRETKSIINGKSEFSEVIIQPISSTSMSERQLNFSPKDQILSNSPKNRAIPKSTQIGNDPIILYCLSLADSLRAMPRSERERVKYEFAKILKDAHYKDQL